MKKGETEWIENGGIIKYIRKRRKVRNNKFHRIINDGE